MRRTRPVTPRSPASRSTLKSWKMVKRRRFVAIEALKEADALDATAESIAQRSRP